MTSLGDRRYPTISSSVAAAEAISATTLGRRESAGARSSEWVRGAMSDDTHADLTTGAPRFGSAAWTRA
jgi:hypothetical protein